MQLGEKRASHTRSSPSSACRAGFTMTARFVWTEKAGYALIVILVITLLQITIPTIYPSIFLFLNILFKLGQVFTELFFLRFIEECDFLELTVQQGNEKGISV